MNHRQVVHALVDMCVMDTLDHQRKHWQPYPLIGVVESTGEAFIVKKVVRCSEGKIRLVLEAEK
jgi:hypothetical protein